MILLAFTICLCISYFFLLFLFSWFFKGKVSTLPKNWLRSIAIISASSILGHIVVINIADAEWANRIQHGLGGGFMSFLVCFLVARDLKLDITKFQFFVFSIFVVTALGVMNEILEYVLQNYSTFLFAVDVNDTWLDLISNCVGILAAALCFTPFINSKLKN